MSLYANAVLAERQAKIAREATDHAAGIAELREVATLAYRALEDAHRVLSTIDGDNTHEQYELDLLAKRVQDAAVSLFTVLRNQTPNDKAQGAVGGLIAGGSPGATGSAAHVETGDGNGTN